MNDTRNEIINIANELIKSVGYNAFSYADIAAKLCVKNAAVHYHFPSKADLGVQVIQHNLSIFREKTALWQNLGLRQQYENYITMHDGFIANNWACVVGALSPSFDTLPDNMQRELQVLINSIIAWLADLLGKGKKSKVFSFDGTPHSKALMIHSTLLSSLLMNKVLRNDVYRIIQHQLLKL